MNAQPDYINYEPTAREELLSQSGSFATAERALFQRLCDSWEPEIDVDRFLGEDTGDGERDRVVLDRLMAKLRSAQLGLLVTRGTGPDQVTRAIILTDKGSLTFFLELLEVELNRIRKAGFTILPSTEILDKRRALPPAYHVTDADTATLVRVYSEETPEPAIYGLRLLGEYRIVVASQTVRTMINSALRWLRTTIEERGLIEELARIKDTGLMDLKQQMATKRPDFWQDIAGTLVAERATIAFRKNLEESNEVFQVAFLLMGFVEAQLGAAKQKKEVGHLIDAELQLLCEQVQKVAGGKMNQEEFATLVDQASGKLGAAGASFSGRLTQAVLTPRPKRRLPIILFIHGWYIHRDRIKSVFETARVEVGPTLQQEYTDLMESFLKGRLSVAGEIFGSKDDLDDDVKERVARIRPLLGEFLVRPQMLAEAVIHDARIRQDGISTDEITGVLGAYFDITTSQLLRASELFDIDVVEIYDAAYSNVNVFRQLFLRISGRFESLRKSYSRRFGPRRDGHRRSDDGSVAPAGGRSEVQPVDAPGLRIRGSGRRDRQSGDDHAESERRAPQAPKPKSPHELDKAWTDFNEAIHKKTAQPPSEDD